jgi:hypothetical protein
MTGKLILGVPGDITYEYLVKDEVIFAGLEIITIFCISPPLHFINEEIASILSVFNQGDDNDRVTRFNLLKKELLRGKTPVYEVFFSNIEKVYMPLNRVQLIDDFILKEFLVDKNYIKIPYKICKKI